MRKEGRQTHRIQDPLRGDTALARHFDTPMHVVELPDRMSVRIDAEDAALIECLLMPAPVEVESPGMSVNFDSDAVFRTRFEDFVDVEIITGPAQQLASGHVPDDCRPRISDRLDDTLRLFLLWQLEAAVHAGDNEIELLQDIIRVIELAVRHDVRLDALQYAKFSIVCLVQPVGFAVLFSNLR